jgi:hypothetical protein
MACKVVVHDITGTREEALQQHRRSPLIVRVKHPVGNPKRKV